MKIKIPVLDEKPMPKVDRSGMAVFVHLIRAPGDPDESIKRGRKNGHDPVGWKKTRKVNDVEQWMELMLVHMHDGKRRTFNKLMVELTGRTADFWFETEADKALWRLVEEGLLHHTMKAPIFFWATRKGRRHGRQGREERGDGSR